MPFGMPRRNVVTFRVDDVESLRLESLKATFPVPTWRTVFVDWLLEQPEVQQLIRKRLVDTPAPFAQRPLFASENGHDVPSADEQAEGAVLDEVRR